MEPMLIKACSVIQEAMPTVMIFANGSLILLAKAKLRGRNLKMVELFGGETIKTTVKDLRTGIVVRVKDYQSYAWWLERKT